MHSGVFKSLIKCPLALLLLLPLSLARAEEAAVWLTDDSVKARISLRYPLVLDYVRKDTGAAFDGASPDERWKVTLIRPDRSEIRLTDDQIRVSVTPGAASVAYAFDCSDEGRVVLRFVATISLIADQTIIKIGSAKSTEGYLLRSIDFGKSIRVALPVSAKDPMICGGTLGRDPSPYFLNDPTKMRPMGDSPLDMAMIGHDGTVVAGYDNLILHPWRYRIHKGDGGPSAEFWCPPYVHAVTAGSGENYIAQESDDFECRIGVLGDRNGDHATDWQDGATFIRDQLPNGPPLFQEYTLYEASGDFDDFRDVIRRLYYVTDGRPQICLLSAWQYWGWDSEYPAYMEPNDELGGREAMYRLMREATRYRCYASLVHNFDDSYASSPVWDPKLVMKRADQSLVEGTAWAGGRSFINGPFKTVRLGWADKVIDGLVAQGARVRMLSDALSATPERIDEDRAMPSDALANLVLGKFKIIDALQRRGIVLGSESVTWPFVGKICSAHSMSLGVSEDPNEVPLGPFVLHSKMAYQARSDGPESLLAGADDATGWDNDRLYLWSMVLERYAKKPMTRYVRDASGYRAEYGKETYVEWPKGVKTARIVVDGRLISNGVSSFLPKTTANVYLAYSKTAQIQWYPRPDGWTEIGLIQAYKLSDGPEALAKTRSLVQLKGDQIGLTLPSGVPIRLCYGNAAYQTDRKERDTHLWLPRITWPADETISSDPPGDRPSWIRRSTRTEPKDAKLYVGCGAKYGTPEPSRIHAASIVARKIAWDVRQGFSGRSREYERRLGLDAAKLGYDDWNLGLDAALDLYSLDKISAMSGAKWRVEKLQDRNPQIAEPGFAYKAFLAVPVTPAQLHSVYVEAIRRKLAEAKRERDRPDDGDRDRLENRIQLWTLMLSEEEKKDR